MVRDSRSRVALIAGCLLLANAANGQTGQTAAAEDARDRIYYPGDTENVKPLARKLAGNLWLDQKQIWTSPFHMNRRNAKWWIGFGAVTAALVVTDRRTSKTFENSKGQISWGNRVSDIGSTYTLVPAVAGFYGVGILADNAKARETAVLSGEALLDSLIVVQVLKPIAGRERPYVAKHPGDWFSGGDSFPSGHSIEAWTLASVVSHEYSHTVWVPFVAYGLAGVVSSARFAAQKHYASDIVAGGAMGWFIGRAVFQTHEDHAHHKHAWLPTPRIAPQISPSSGTYAVGVTFPLTPIH